MSNIHKTAIIEDGAILGENVTVGALVYPDPPFVIVKVEIPPADTKFRLERCVCAVPSI